MIQRSLMIAQFPGGGTTAWETARYVATLTAHLVNEPRISRVVQWDQNDTPITMTRNKALLEAENQNVDYVLMIDNDMVPDLPLDGAKPFFPTALDFMLAHETPCVVAAPYCGPPPHELVYVFQWVQRIHDSKVPDFAIEMLPRSKAAQLRGIQRAAALPTGLILIDMRAVAKLPHPRFYYEWKDETESQKASTEDVTFTRDLTCVGVPIYCNWDAWAGHIKKKIVGPALPMDLLPDSIPKLLRKNAKLHEQEGTTEPIPAQRLRPHNRWPVLPKAAAEPVVVDCRGEEDGVKEEQTEAGYADWLAAPARNGS